LGGSRKYYADAERFGRNHLLETQFLSLEQLQQGVDRLPAIDKPTPENTAAWTQNGVTASQIGAFASRSTINDAFHLDASALMQCCNAAGGRALYDLWHYAIDDHDAANGHRALQVNLRFSVESPALRVASHEPAEGRLDLTATDSSRIAVRLPAGVNQAIVVIGDERCVRSLESSNGYVSFDLIPGQSAEMHYALPDRVSHYQLGTPEKNEQGTGYWRGETMLRVDPPGRYYPLYERSTDVAPVQPSPATARGFPSL
jgi:hypothetical protein